MKVEQKLFYGYTDSQNNLFNKALVQHMDGETEALFLSPAASQKGNILEQVIERCLIEVQDEFGNACKDSKHKIVQSLAPGDINLLVLAVSTATHEDENRELNPACPKCKKLNVIKFNVNQLDYNKPDGVPPKRFEVKVGPRTFTMEWLPLAKINELAQEVPVEKIDEKLSIINQGTLRNKMMKVAIKTIKNGDKIETLADVPGRVLTKLNELWQEKLTYGVNLEIDCTCFDCQHKWKQNLLEVVTEEGQPGGLFHFFGIVTRPTE